MMTDRDGTPSRGGRPRALVIEAEEHYFLAESTLELLGPLADLHFLLGRGLTPGNRATKDWREMFRSRADGRGVTLARHRTIFLRAIAMARRMDLIYVQTGPDFGRAGKALAFWLLCRLLGRRTVVSLHEITAYVNGSGRLADRIRASALRHVSGVVFESEALRAFYREHSGAGRGRHGRPLLGVVRVRYARPSDEWPTLPPAAVDGDDRLAVGLVGGVTHKRRDYSLLRAALEGLDPTERARIRLVTLGNCTKRRCLDIMEPFRALVDVDLVNRHLSEEEFLARGSACRVLVAPLVSHFAYGRRKGTGAYADAVRLARPIIIPRDSDPMREYAALTLPYDDQEGLTARLREAVRQPPRLGPGALAQFEATVVRDRLFSDLRLGPDLHPVTP